MLTILIKDETNNLYLSRIQKKHTIVKWTGIFLIWEIDVHSVSQIFAAIMFVDDCGTKNPYQNSLSLWRRQNWKPVTILGREINLPAQHKQKSMGSPVFCTLILLLTFNFRHFKTMGRGHCVEMKRLKMAHASKSQYVDRSKLYKRS